MHEKLIQVGDMVSDMEGRIDTKEGTVVGMLDGETVGRFEG